MHAERIFLEHLFGSCVGPKARVREVSYIDREKKICLPQCLRRKLGCRPSTSDGGPVVRGEDLNVVNNGVVEVLTLVWLVVD